MGKFDLARLTEVDPSLLDTVERTNKPMGLPAAKAKLAAYNHGKPLGEQAIDQTAGDLDNLDQPNPLPDVFFQLLKEMRTRFKDFAAIDGSATGFAEGYYANPAPGINEVLKYFKFDPSTVSVTTGSSGRAVISNLMAALDRGTNNAKTSTDGRKALIQGPLSWPGYSAIAEDLHSTVVTYNIGFDPESPFGITRNNVIASNLKMGESLDRVSLITPIIPDNPSGNTSVDFESIHELAQWASRENAHVLIDAFYFYVSQDPHALTTFFSELRDNLPSDELKSRISLLIGTTKGFGTDPRFAMAINLSPDNPLLKTAGIIAANRSNYATRQAALIAATAFSFPGGPNKAMGERYNKLRGNHDRLQDILAKYEIAGPENSGSFYLTPVLLDEKGESLIRNSDGNPSCNPEDTMNVMLQCGIGIASPELWRPWRNDSVSGVMPRLSFATTWANLEKIDQAFDRLRNSVVKSTIKR